MRGFISAALAAAIVFAGACLTTSSARADTTGPVQSWSDLHAQYDGVVDRVEQAQKGPGAIGGGPAVIPAEEQILRVYRTPSPADGFWSDFHLRVDNAIGAAEAGSSRAAP